MRKDILHSFTVEQLASQVDATVQGAADMKIDGVASLKTATATQLSFVKDNQYANLLAQSQAGAVLVAEPLAEQCPNTALVVDNPEVSFAKLARLFVKHSLPPAMVHPSAVIGEHCEIDDTVHVGANVVIGDGVRIGSHTVIMANCVIGENSVIGEHCHFYPNTTLYHQVSIGNRVILHSGVVIGADGFGLAFDQDHWEKIPQLGRVILHDDVEVGANSTIDRGALDDTVIGKGVKLDNLIQIAHNVTVGEHTVMAAKVGIAGSARIGKNCMLGGSVAVRDHVEIVDGGMVAACSTVVRSIDKAGLYMCGFMAVPANEWKRKAFRMMQVDDLFKRVKKLEASHERDE